MGEVEVKRKHGQKSSANTPTTNANDPKVTPVTKVTFSVRLVTDGSLNPKLVYPFCRVQIQLALRYNIDYCYYSRVRSICQFHR